MSSMRNKLTKYISLFVILVGITGLSLKSFKDNWGSDYQTTNNAGIPDPNGEIYWHFK